MNHWLRLMFYSAARLAAGFVLPAISLSAAEAAAAENARINITGLDSRMGTIGNHADANHILSVLLDSGAVEIISIPRDTPADAGLDDRARAGHGSNNEIPVPGQEIPEPATIVLISLGSLAVLRKRRLQKL